MQNVGRQIRCIMGDVQVANTAQNTVYKSMGTKLVLLLMLHYSKRILSSLILSLFLPRLTTVLSFTWLVTMQKL